MKIIIFGNLGYIGPNVVKQLRRSFPDSELIGFDIGYFAHCLTNAYFSPEIYLNQQFYGDIRTVDKSILEGADAIVDFYENERYDAFSKEVAIEKKKYSWDRFAEELIQLNQE